VSPAALNSHSLGSELHGGQTGEVSASCDTSHLAGRRALSPYHAIGDSDSNIIGCPPPWLASPTAALTGLFAA